MNEDRHIQEVKSTTTLRFNDLWQQNFQANRNIIQKNPGVVALTQKFKGVPAIIVGAGPSLDKNINLLGRAQGHSLILASDAALKPLLSQGVLPSVVVSLLGLNHSNKCLCDIHVGKLQRLTQDTTKRTGLRNANSWLPRFSRF